MKTRKLAYIGAKGDVYGTYQYWRKGVNDPRIPNIGYSHQLYNLCLKHNLVAYVVSEHPLSKEINSNQFKFNYLKTSNKKNSKLAWHIFEIIRVLKIIVYIAKIRPGILVLSNQSYWFLFSVLFLFNVHVIPTLHCTISPKRGSNYLGKIINHLSGKLFFSKCHDILVASEDIKNEVMTLSGSCTTEPKVFFPTYDNKNYCCFAEPKKSDDFNILYIGRIEISKGVVELVKIAQILSPIKEVNIRFHICGDGSALHEMKTHAKNLRIDEMFQFYGHVSFESGMTEIIAKSHAFIVPTPSRFIEGFNQVVIEGVLSKRPIISSIVCPSTQYVPDAVVFVEPDDLDEYVSAILKLIRNKEFFASKVKATNKYRTHFFSKDYSFENLLDQALMNSIAIT